MGNSRFKFRAWDEQNKVMHNEVEFIRSGIDGNDWILFKSDKQKLEDGNVLNNPYFQQQIKLMQYTGLKDKNGVEIYEGDIVKDGSRLWKIQISPIYGIFFILTKGGHSRCYGDFGSYLVDEFKVIGNIYENKELLA